MQYYKHSVRKITINSVYSNTHATAGLQMSIIVNVSFSKCILVQINMHQLKKVQSGEAYFNNRYLLFHLVLCRFMMNFSTLTLEGLLKAMLQ